MNLHSLKPYKTYIKMPAAPGNYIIKLTAGFGVLSGWIGLLLSYLFNVPSGATIVITSSVIFMIAAIFSPKRKVKGWQKKPLLEEGSE